MELVGAMILNAPGTLGTGRMPGPGKGSRASHWLAGGTYKPTFPRCAPGLRRSYPPYTVEGAEFSPQPTYGLIFRFSCARKPICQYFPSSRRTSPVVSTSPWISSAYAGAGLRRRSSIRLRIFRNKFLGTATSANWKVTYRPSLTTLAPIPISFSRSVVSDQCSASSGSAHVACGS